MSDSAKILSLSSDSAAATKTSALKTYFRSVRLIKNTNTLSPTNIPSYITNILLCGNCIDPETRCLYVFYIDTSVIGAAWIIEINIDTREQVVVYYDKYNAIGFNKDNKIYNARVVHGRIIWTDNLNPIYQMDIERAKNSFRLKIGYGQYPVTVEWSAIVNYGIDQIVSNGNNFYKSRVHNNLNHEPRMDSFVLNIGTYWEKLCLIEDAYYSMDVRNFYFEPAPPKHPPVVSYESDPARKINNLRQTLFQVAYRYVYMDWRKSTFSPASIVPVPQAEEETATGLANEMIELNNKLNIRVNTGGEEVRAIEIIGRSSQDPSKWFLIETINKFEEQERGGEVSVTSEPGYITLTMTVMPPTVINVGIPNAPVAIYATGVTDTRFIANWEVVVGAIGYYLDVATDAGFTSFVAGYNSKILGTVLSDDVTGLTELTYYYYRIRAYSTIGTSVNSITIPQRTSTFPSTVIATAATSIGTTFFYANWNQAAWAAGYYIDVSTDPNFNTFSPNYNNRDTGSILTTYYIRGLLSGTTYYYRIRVYNRYGQVTGSSNIITVTTLM